MLSLFVDRCDTAIVAEDDVRKAAVWPTNNMAAMAVAAEYMVARVHERQ